MLHGCASRCRIAANFEAYASYVPCVAYALSCLLCLPAEELSERKADQWRPIGKKRRHAATSSLSPRHRLDGDTKADTELKLQPLLQLVAILPLTGGLFLSFHPKRRKLLGPS